MVSYNRRDLALTFARDRRAGTVRRILEFAAQTKEEGTKSDILFWAPAPLRSVITALLSVLRKSTKLRAKKRFHIDQKKMQLREEKRLALEQKKANAKKQDAAAEDGAENDDDNKKKKKEKKNTTTRTGKNKSSRKQKNDDSDGANKNSGSDEEDDENDIMNDERTDEELLQDFVFEDSSDDEDQDAFDDQDQQQPTFSQRQRNYSSNVEHQPFTTDIIMYILSFLNPTKDYDSFGWRSLPLPPKLSHPRLPPEQFTALLNHRAQHSSSLIIDALSSSSKVQSSSDDEKAMMIASSLMDDAAAAFSSSYEPPKNLQPRLYRCSLYPPAEPAPKNFLIVRVLTPHRYVSNEELNMFLGRYGFVNSEPLSPDGFILSEAEAAAATQQSGHRAGTIRVLQFLVQLDSAQVAHRAIENCLVAQIDFLSWAVQVPYVEENYYLKTTTIKEKNNNSNHRRYPLLLAPPTQQDLKKLDTFDHDPCVFPVSCLPAPEKLWLKPLVDVGGLVRRRKYLMLMNRSLMSAADQQNVDASGQPRGGGGVAGGTNADGTVNTNNNNTNALQNALDDGGLGDIRMIPEITVDGLPYWTTDEMLLQRCAEFGTVKRIRFSVNDRTGAHYGCAAVTMSSVAEAVKLHDGLHGRVIEGETVVCGILEAFYDNNNDDNQEDDGGKSSSKQQQKTGEDDGEEKKTGNVYYALVSLRTGELVSWE